MYRVGCPGVYRLAPSQKCDPGRSLSYRLTGESPAGQLNYWLSRFVVEARRADGERYPSATLYQLLSGLLRYARSKLKGCPNFLDKKDQRFAELRGTCESVSRDLRQAGVGAKVNHAPVIDQEEDKLWDSRAIGIYSPKALVRCVFYYVGKAFYLRGGQEPRGLKPSQLERGRTWFEEPPRWIWHKSTFEQSRDHLCEPRCRTKRSGVSGGLLF